MVNTYIYACVYIHFLCTEVSNFLIVEIPQCREMIWLSTSGSSCLALPSVPMGGCNLMDLGVWSHQSSMVMWAAQSQWLSSGPLRLRAWLPAQWRGCLQALSPFSTGPLLEMISPGKGKEIETANNKKRSYFFSFWPIFLILTPKSSPFPDLKLAIRLLWPSRMKLKILRRLALMLSKLMRLLWERVCLLGSPSKLSTWNGLFTPSVSPTVVLPTLPRFFPASFFFFWKCFPASFKSHICWPASLFSFL